MRIIPVQLQKASEMFPCAFSGSNEFDILKITLILKLYAVVTFNKNITRQLLSAQRYI